MEIGFKFKTFYSYIMINYHLSQQLKLLGNDEFNHFIIFQTQGKLYFLYLLWNFFSPHFILTHIRIRVLPLKKLISIKIYK